MNRAHSKNNKILVVDDSTMYAAFLCNSLKDEYNCDFALDGKTAIKKANDNLPDLILLDVVMPDIDGYTVCEILKGKDKTREIPIIFLTNKNDTEDIVNGLNLGAVDYITKPFCLPIVRARINNHLKTQSLLAGLRTTIQENNVLRGLLPICTHCKRVRDNQGDWHDLDKYLSNHSEIIFSYGICVECQDRLF